VGDKWILFRIACLNAECQLAHLLKKIKNQRNNSLLKEILKKASALKVKLRACKNAGVFDVYGLRDIESSVNSLLLEIENTEKKHIPFAVGSEETGHNITQGNLEGNPPTAIFFGNGLKSALNTFSATQFLLRNKSVRQYFSRLERPFKKGFKESYHAYYINKELFYKNSPLWRRIKNHIIEESKRAGFHCMVLNFREDPDMLYLALNPCEPVRSREGSPKRASPENGIFIRNSGTENKISVNLRGDKKNARALKSIGETCIRLLIPALKDKTSRYHRLELSLLNRMEETPFPETALKDPSQKRVATEMLKQGLIKSGAKGYRLTARGKWYNTAS